MTSAVVSAGFAAVVAGAAMPDVSESSNLALADADASVTAADSATRFRADDRASRTDGRDATATAATQVAADLFVLPLPECTVTSKFGPHWGSEHPGVDLAARNGTPYAAIAAGKVILARANGGYGLNVIIDHGGGVVSVYAHSSKLLVQEGQTVEAGQAIGLVGDSGYSFGPQLHLEIRVDGKQVDPMPWLTGKGADLVDRADAPTR
jgi:murein DD-endopeptidase MepM/ murein hydrolase activator NlpD